MTKIVLAALLAGAAGLTACAAVPADTVATATAAGKVCGQTGYVDLNNDGWISGDEWNTFRTTDFPFWDVNRDGRVDRTEFENCYRGGGFYRDAYYNPDYWSNYWSAFDANGDGFLSPDEYWSSDAWNRLDRNHNGRIDSDEWTWWNG